MSNIPEARRILSEVATALHAGRCSRGDAAALIDEALSMMTRERMVRRAPEKSKPLTAEVRAKIFAMAKTDMHMGDIAHQLGINQGRVSEVLTGKR